MTSAWTIVYIVFIFVVFAIGLGVGIAAYAQKTRKNRLLPAGAEWLHIFFGFFASFFEIGIGAAEISLNRNGANEKLLE